VTSRKSSAESRVPIGNTQRRVHFFHPSFDTIHPSLGFPLTLNPRRPVFYTFDALSSPSRINFFRRKTPVSSIPSWKRISFGLAHNQMTNTQNVYVRTGLPDRPNARREICSLNVSHGNQCDLLLEASSSCRSTTSRLNAAGFWRGGNCLNASICWATSACIP
jgi:hypothetical protein